MNGIVQRHIPDLAQHVAGELFCRRVHERRAPALVHHEQARGSVIRDRSVDRQLLLKRLLRPLLLSHVPEFQHGTDHFAILLQRLDVANHREQAAVLANKDVFVIIYRHQLGLSVVDGTLRHRVRAPVWVPVMNGIVQRHIPDLVQHVAGELFCRRVHKRRTAVLVHHEQARCSVIRDGSVDRQLPLKRLLVPLALRDVDERYNRPDDPALGSNRIRPVFGREARPVRPPENFVIEVRIAALLEGLEDPTFVNGKRRAVGAVVVDQVVHVAAQQFAGVLVAQHSDAGGVAESAVSLDVQTVDRLRGRIQQEPESLLALTECFLRPLSLEIVCVQQLRRPPGQAGENDDEGQGHERPAKLSRVKPRPFADHQQPAEQDRHPDYRRQHAPRQHAARTVVAERAHPARRRPRQQDTHAEEQETKRCVQSHGRHGYGAIKRPDGIQVADQGGQRHDQRRHNDELGWPVAAARGHIQHQQRQPHAHIIERGAGRHAAGVNRFRRSGRFWKEEIVQAQVPAAPILHQREQSDQRDGAGADLRPATRLRFRRFPAQQPQTHTRQKEAPRRVDLHRDPDRQDAFERRDVQHPPQQDHAAKRDDAGAGRLAKHPEPSLQWRRLSHAGFFSCDSGTRRTPFRPGSRASTSSAASNSVAFSKKCSVPSSAQRWRNSGKTLSTKTTTTQSGRSRFICSRTRSPLLSGSSMLNSTASGR